MEGQLTCRRLTENRIQCSLQIIQCYLAPKPSEELERTQAKHEMYQKKNDYSPSCFDSS